jgi:hypothetical protein
VRPSLHFAKLLHFAKERMHHLHLPRRAAAPQNVRDIDRGCSWRATALRARFFAPLKLVRHQSTLTVTAVSRYIILAVIYVCSKRFNAFH